MRLPGVSLPIVNDPRSRSAEAKLRLLPHTSGSVVDPGRTSRMDEEQKSPRTRSSLSHSARWDSAGAEAAAIAQAAEGEALPQAEAHGDRVAGRYRAETAAPRSRKT